MSQTNDDVASAAMGNGSGLWEGRERRRDFPISPIDEVGRKRRSFVRLLVFITQLTATRVWWAIRNS